MNYLTSITILLLASACTDVQYEQSTTVNKTDRCLIYLMEDDDSSKTKICEVECDIENEVLWLKKKDCY